MNEEYMIRKATKDDAGAILELYHSNVGTEGCSWNLEYPDMLEIERDTSEDSLYCLTNAEGEIIAAAFAGPADELNELRWDPNIKHPCELARIGVRPELHGKGIATILLQYIISDVKQRGYDSIRMLVSKTNQPALALYNKNGFTCCGETVMYDIDFYCYERSV